MPVKYTSTFRAPSEYERQIEEARRRQMLAEVLAQQQYEPSEGNAAPIPRAAPLVKALQSYLTARQATQARQAGEEAKAMEGDYAQRMLGRMEGGYTYDPKAQPVTVPEQTQLEEVTRQSQYKQAPEEALAMASTTLGAATLKDRPIMAARLAKMLETPKVEAPYAKPNPKDYTPDSWKAFTDSGYRDTTVLRPWESTLTPQQLADFAIRSGQFGLQGKEFQFKTGQPAPGMPNLQNVVTPPGTPAPVGAPPPVPTTPTTAAPTPTVGAATPSAAAPGAKPPVRGARPEMAKPEAAKPKSAIEVATPEQRLKLQQEFPQARTAAQVGLAKLDQLDAYLADLENHKGLDSISGKLGQYEVTDLTPEARSARSVLNAFLQGASIQAVNEAREASKNGGGYGSMTVQEWPRLEGIFGPIAAAKDAPDLRRAIRNAREGIKNARNRYVSSWQGTYGDTDIGYSAPKYEPESSAYPLTPKAKSSNRTVADQILEDERKRAGGR